MKRRPTEQELAEWQQAHFEAEKNFPKRPDYPDDQIFHWVVKNLVDSLLPDYLYTTDESDGGMLPTLDESVGTPSPPPPPISDLASAGG